MVALHGEELGATVSPSFFAALLTLTGSQPLFTSLKSIYVAQKAAAESFPAFLSPALELLHLDGPSPHDLLAHLPNHNVNPRLLEMDHVNLTHRNTSSIAQALVSLTRLRSLTMNGPTTQELTADAPSIRDLLAGLPNLSDFDMRDLRLHHANRVRNWASATQHLSSFRYTNLFTIQSGQSSFLKALTFLRVPLPTERKQVQCVLGQLGSGRLHTLIFRGPSGHRVALADLLPAFCLPSLVTLHVTEVKIVCEPGETLGNPFVSLRTTASGGQALRTIVLTPNIEPQPGLLDLFELSRAFPVLRVLEMGIRSSSQMPTRTDNLTPSPHSLRELRIHEHLPSQAFRPIDFTRLAQCINAWFPDIREVTSNNEPTVWRHVSEMRWLLLGRPIEGMPDLGPRGLFCTLLDAM
jgi:hypothetical protein